MEIILVNAFSINMLPGGNTLRFREIVHPEDLILQNTLLRNAIGHPETDRVVRTLLEQGGANIPPGERTNVVLEPGQALLVAQYKGPRLPEGATELPVGAKIEWWLVEQVTAL